MKAMAGKPQLATQKVPAKIKAIAARIFDVLRAESAELMDGTGTSMLAVALAAADFAGQLVGKNCRRLGEEAAQHYRRAVVDAVLHGYTEGWADPVLPAVVPDSIGDASGEPVEPAV